MPAQGMLSDPDSLFVLKGGKGASPSVTPRAAFVIFIFFILASPSVAPCIVVPLVPRALHTRARTHVAPVA